MGYFCQQLVVLDRGNRYNKKLFLRKGQFNIKNSHVKPKAGCGLWTSTYTPHDDTPSGWYEWCVYNQQNWNGNEGVLVTVKNNARVCTINSYEDLLHLIEEYPFCNGDSMSWDNTPKTYLNFVMMKKDFDIIHLTWEGQHQTHFTSSPFDLYGWDCESSLHLNNVIQSFKKINL